MNLHRKKSFLIVSLAILALVIGVVIANSQRTRQPPGETEAKTAPVDTPKAGEQEEKAKSQEKIEKEMIEDEIRYWRPKVPKLIEGLKSKDWEERAGCVYALGQALDMRAVAPLIEVLLNDERVYVRTNAAVALGSIENYHKDTTAIPALISALNDVFNVRITAAGVLVMFGNKKEVVPVLASIVRGEGKEDWVIDYEGYMGIENMTEEEVEAEVKRMKRIDQISALKRLAEVGTRESISVLKDIAFHHEDVALRRKAERVLENLEEKSKERKDEEEQ